MTDAAPCATLLRPRPGSRPRRRVIAGLGLSGALLLAGCSTTVDNASTSASASASAQAGTAATAAAGTVFDPTTVHEISIDVDDAQLAAMIETYRKTDEKEWLEATVTIDGQKFTRAGIRLKGNSSLRNITTDTDPSALPLLIRLDKYVDDQALDGYTEFIVRSSSTKTSINEAVSLDLLRAAGLASEQAIATRFSVNGSDAQLRLVVQNLDETWQASSFSDDGILYKAEAEGDWTYRGADPDDYTDVFDQETGEDNLTPLIEFLDFVNNSTDAQFQADLSKHLDVEAFATYLAFEDLVSNFDDIDGPGNNAYLYWDSDTGQFTVVAWDHNLAFGAGPGGGGGFGGSRGQGGRTAPGGGAGQRPTDLPTDLPSGMPTDFPGGMPPGGMGGQDAPGGQGQGDQSQGNGLVESPQNGGRGGFSRSRSNPLVNRFLAVDEFAAMKTAATARLTQALVTSGAAQESVDQWVSVLKSSGLVEEATIESEATTVTDRLAQLGSATQSPSATATPSAAPTPAATGAETPAANAADTSGLAA